LQKEEANDTIVSRADERQEEENRAKESPRIIRRVVTAYRLWYWPMVVRSTMAARQSLDYQVEKATPHELELLEQWRMGMPPLV